MGTNETDDLPGDKYDMFDYVPPSTRPDRLPVWYWIVLGLVLVALAYALSFGVRDLLHNEAVDSDGTSQVIVGGHTQAPLEKKPSLSDMPAWQQSIAFGTPAG